MYLCFPHTLLQRHQSSVKIGSETVWEVLLYLVCLFWRWCSRQMQGRWDRSMRGWWLTEEPGTAGNKEAKTRNLWETRQLSQCYQLSKAKWISKSGGQEFTLHVCMHTCRHVTDLCIGTSPSVPAHFLTSWTGGLLPRCPVAGPASDFIWTKHVSLC